jgi:hypothetical protein
MSGIMRPVFQRRDFSGGVRPQVDWTVERYSRTVFGGPKAATLQARGEDLDLWSLVNLLRSPVEIWAPEGDAVWWGQVSEVSGTAGNPFNVKGPRINFGVTLDTMRNRIALAYTLPNAAGEETRMTTAWDDAGGNDIASQNEYGIRELLCTASASTTAHAEAARAMKLSQVKYPAPTLSLNYDAGESGVSVLCRGWWETLDWKYCAVPLRLAISYTDVGLIDLYAINYAIGNNTNFRVAQEIQVSTTVNLASISVYALKYGAPADNLSVGIYTCVDHAPDTQLASGSLAGGDLGLTAAWHSVTIDTTELTPGMYCIVLERSGSQDAGNYYLAQLNHKCGYTQGAFLVEQGGPPAWANAGNVGDMLFALYADEPVETTQQIADLAVNFGQFIREVAVDDQSGITVESYRDGDSTALYEILLMLQMGTSNHRRLLVDIDRTRRLRIYEEPELPANPHQLWSDGQIADALGRPLRKAECPVGMWARWKDVVPASINTSLLADPSLVFIDENEYDVANDRLSPTPRGVMDAWDWAKVKDG